MAQRSTSNDHRNEVSRVAGQVNRAEAVAKWDAANRELAKELGLPEPPPTPVKRGRPPNWVAKKREVVAARALNEINRRMKQEDEARAKAAAANEPEPPSKFTVPDLTGIAKLDTLDKVAASAAVGGLVVRVVHEEPTGNRTGVEVAFKQAEGDGDA